MARARNIKPSIMDNEELAELEPLTRLLFVYLWMLADRCGRLEDRPKRIGAQALAYDRSADVNAMLDDLQRLGFILRYKAAGVACIQIVAFEKHQNPHVRESASELPAPEQGTTKDKPKHNLGSAEPSPRSPDSGFRIPDSLIPDCVCDTPAHTQAVHNFREVMKSRPDLNPETVFQAWKAHYSPDKRTWDKWLKWVAREQSPTQKPPSTADPDSRASVEAMGMSLGLGKWNEATEQWPTYKARVKKGQPA